MILDDKTMILDGKQERENDLQHLIDVIDGIVLADVINLKAGFKPGQARDKDGQWTTGAGWHKINEDEVLDTHMESYDPEYDQYGSTYDPLTGKNLMGTDGFSVSVYLDETFTPGDGNLRNLEKTDISNYLKKYKTHKP